MGGYAPAIQPDDDEELGRKLYPELYPPAESTAPAHSEFASLAESPDYSLAPAPATTGFRLPKEAAADLGPPPAEPVSSPVAPAPAMRPAQARLASLAAQGAPPVQPLHGFKKGLDILGQIYAPAVEQRLRYGPQREYARQLNEAAAQEKAEEQAIPQPKPKEEKWSTVTGVTDANGRVLQQEENSGQMRWAPGIGGVEPVKQPTEKEDDKPLSTTGTTPDAVNAQFERRWQVLHKDQPLPADLKLGPTAKVGDYKRVDAALKAEESTEGTAATRENTQVQRGLENTRRAEQDQEKREERAEKKQTDLQKDRDKFVEPLQSSMDNYDLQKTYVEGGQHTGTGDYQLMLQFQEAIVAGQKAGIRFNQAEQSRIEHARSLMDSASATIRHLTTGTYFSQTQRQELLAAMKTVRDAHEGAIGRWDREHNYTAGGESTKNDFGPAPAGKADGATGTLPDGTKVVVKKGRLVAQ